MSAQAAAVSAGLAPRASVATRVRGSSAAATSELALLAAFAAAQQQQRHAHLSGRLAALGEQGQAAAACSAEQLADAQAEARAGSAAVAAACSAHCDALRLAAAATRGVRASFCTPRVGGGWAGCYPIISLRV